ncbi:MAG: ribosome biogenesis GTPase Der [Chloroflexi bacterium]|mgnify:FL=1|nr:ribosome biogenesis GTPase Der [Chloroflexota bacterium]|tara:strand:- start:1199 stop:2542 length:1344 start_codon:yes stop_codon:yes gene_type:complete
MKNHAMPLVAIVGRPNVGKSTIFNRIIGDRQAIVSDIAGTTRDRLITETEWANKRFLLVDTGGLESTDPTTSPTAQILDKVQSQVEVAIEDADVIIFATDADTGITPDDAEVAQKLRVSGNKVVLAVNKADNIQREADTSEFYKLGLGDPIPISAYHNHGVDDLMMSVVERLPSNDLNNQIESDVRLSIVGRANVGKSQLLNALTGDNRSIVSDIPGTTRDAIDSSIRHKDKSILLIDTAGIRRRGRIEPGIENYSVIRSIRAVERSEVSLLVLDATELATSQDSHVASYLLQAYRGIVIVVNKWDLSKDLGISKDDAKKIIRQRMKFLHFVPIQFTSALNKAGLDSMLNTVFKVHLQWNQELPRYDLRRTILNAVADHPPASNPRHGLKLYGVTQDRFGPPGFTFYVNRSDLVHFSYRRYLENTLRKTYGFDGTPLKMRFKGRGEH